jgi:hypothetical protein
MGLSPHRRITSLTPLLVVVALVCGCGSNGGDTGTPTATISASQTGPPSGTPLAAFRPFAENVKQALLNGDVSSILGTAVQSTITCKNELGLCAGQPSGSTATGLPHVVWQQDSDTVLSSEAFGSVMKEFLGATSQTPPPGYPKFAAIIAIDNPERISEVFAGKGQLFGVVIASVVAQPEGAPPAERAQVLLFQSDGSEWRLVGGINSGSAIEDWTSGSCSDCYDDWEAF